MEKNFTNTPFIALDYLTKGDSTNLNQEQIRMADDWAKDWEIISVEEISEDEPIGNKRLEPCMVAEDREFDDDYKEIA
ncbi:MAG: hypothetical protein J1E95_01585 [Muribaculaceae bacterium]|nr:hypothetical protein [Muribaculaceae bacterium]